MIFDPVLAGTHHSATTFFNVIAAVTSVRVAYGDDDVYS